MSRNRQLNNIEQYWTILNMYRQFFWDPFWHIRRALPMVSSRAAPPRPSRCRRRCERRRCNDSQLQRELMNSRSFWSRGASCVSFSGEVENWSSCCYNRFYYLTFFFFFKYTFFIGCIMHLRFFFSGLQRFFFSLFFLTILLQNQVLWWEKASGKGKLYQNRLKSKTVFKTTITLLRVIPTMTSTRFVTGKSSGICSGISSGILSGRWGPAVLTELEGPRLRSSGAHWARRVPGWGPAVLTELGRSQVEVQRCSLSSEGPRLRPSGAQCAQTLAVEVQQCPLRAEVGEELGEELARRKWTWEWMQRWWRRSWRRGRRRRRRRWRMMRRRRRRRRTMWSHLTTLTWQVGKKTYSKP